MAGHTERIESPDGKNNGYNGASLSRQVTVTLDPADYERLFFQPSQAKGDLAKMLGKTTRQSFERGQNRRRPNH